MLTLADLKFAVFEAGSLWPYTWKRTREEAERVALERSQWTGKPHLVESDEEYQARHDAHFLATFPLQEITEEFHDEMLNVLPPMYRQGALGFFMCEFTAGTITSQFARYEGKHYGAAVDICNAQTWITPEKIEALPVTEPATWFPKEKGAA